MKEQRYIYIFLFFVFITGNLIIAKSPDRKWIGIIENQHGHSIARIIMMKDDTIWKPLTEEGPAHIIDNNILTMKWHVLFDGKEVGSFDKIEINKSKKYSEINNYEIVDTSNIINKKKNRNLFANWLGVPEYRPLIAVSAANPASIKLIQGSLLKGERKRLVKEFRSIIKEVFICNNVEGPLVRYKYKDSDIKIPSVYTIPKLGRIIKMRLNSELMQCDFNDYYYWSDIWLLLKDDGNITVLDPDVEKDRILRLMIVDAGDYDDDRKIDIVFSISAYNLGGYILFYNDCKESVNATWNYH